MQLATQKVYDQWQTDTLGDWWNAVGQIGSVAAGWGLSQLGGGGQQGGSTACRAPAGCFQCPMTGQGDIAGCIDIMLVGPSGIYPLLVGGANPNLGGRIPNDQVFQVYQAASAALNNPAYFAGSSAYLTQARAAVQRAITEYRNANPAGSTPAGSTGTGTTTQVVTDPTTGQQIVIQVPAAGGIDNTTLLIVGGAALGLLLLLKN